MLIDFTRETTPWASIDDRVMGGMSKSVMRVDNGVATFSGEVSLANNGGFASVRSRPHDSDLSGYDGLALRVRGDGKAYGIRVRTSRSFDGVSYQAPLAPEAGIWREVVIPFEELVPVFRGQLVVGHPDLDPASVQTFGLIVSGKQTGPFRLEIAWIKGWKQADATVETDRGATQ